MKKNMLFTPYFPSRSVMAEKLQSGTFFDRIRTIESRDSGSMPFFKRSSCSKSFGGDELIHTVDIMGEANGKGSVMRIFNGVPMPDQEYPRFPRHGK